MSKKEEKSSKLNNMLERRVEKSLKWPLLTQEQLHECVESVWDNKPDEGEGWTYIGFDDYSQSLPNKSHLLTGDAVVMLHRMNADNPIWLHSSKDTITIKEYTIIGKDGKPETNPKTRAFWKGKIEENDPYISELESIYVAVIANDTRLQHSAYYKYTGYEESKKYDPKQDYVLLTRFTNGELFHLNLTEAIDVFLAKMFISDFGNFIKSKTPTTNMPRADVFERLIADLTPPPPDRRGRKKGTQTPTTTNSKKMTSTIAIVKDDTPPPSINKANRKKVLEAIVKEKGTPLPSGSVDSVEDASTINAENNDTSFPANSEDDKTEIGDDTKE